MAVTKRTYEIPAYWNSNDLLDTLQTALADVGFHANTQTGTILTFTNTAGTTIVGEKGKRYLVKQSATSGSGQYATFDVVRNQNTGAVATVTLVNGGIDYVGTNTLTISGANIGGTSPTDDITVTVSTVSGAQGSTTTWYDKDTASPYTWGVCCINNDITKKMGQTYFSFYTPANPTAFPVLYIKSGPGFQSTTNVFNGVLNLDYVTNSTVFNTAGSIFSLTIASAMNVPLTLITYQSGLDPNFVVFQFAEISTQGQLYRWPFVISKYNSATQPWSLDDCFTAGVYLIGKTQVVNTTEGNVYTQLATGFIGRRAGEWGYSGASSAAGGLIGYYESLAGRKLGTGVNTTYPVIYNRTEQDYIHTGVEYNPVITGIPINNCMVPCPYFIPEDFGISEILDTNSINYGSIVSVGATTKWEVIQYGNNQAAATYNGCMTFLAKIVD